MTIELDWVAMYMPSHSLHDLHEKVELQAMLWNHFLIASLESISEILFLPPLQDLLMEYLAVLEL